MGCISPRFIYSELKKYENQFGTHLSTYWLIFELLWRDYFRFMMKKYKTKFFQEGGIQNKGKTINNNKGIYFLDFIFL